MNLPPFKVAPYWVDTSEGSFDMLRVRCPRKGCERDFWVARIWGLITLVEGRSDDPPARVVGRMCPYCSRASAIPEEFQIGVNKLQESMMDEVAENFKPKRRIVRRRKSKS